jgi:hypothetical protein
MPGLVAKFHALGQVNLTRVNDQVKALGEATARADETLSILGTVPQVDLDGRVASRVINQVSRGTSLGGR